MKLRTVLEVPVTVAVAVVSVLALASPAVAKGTSTVTVKGPGVARPIALDSAGTRQLNDAAGLYTPPGQRVFKTEPPFQGGWYRAGPPITDLLVSFGVPARAGSTADQRS